MNAFVIEAMRNERVRVDRTLRVEVLHAGALHVDQAAILHDAPHHAGNVRVEAIVLHRPIDLGDCRGGRLGERRADEETAAIMTIVTVIATRRALTLHEGG